MRAVAAHPVTRSQLVRVPAAAVGPRPLLQAREPPWRARLLSQRGKVRTKPFGTLFFFEDHAGIQAPHVINQRSPSHRSRRNSMSSNKTGRARPNRSTVIFGG
jgi:hypothetical protein